MAMGDKEGQQMSDQLLPTRERIRGWLAVVEANGGHPDSSGQWTLAVAYAKGQLIDGSDITEVLANPALTGFYCTTHKAIGRENTCDEWLDDKPYRPCTMVEYVGYLKSFVDVLIEEGNDEKR